MSNWRWLTENAQHYTWGFLARVILKAALLFVLLNVIYALVQPLPFISQLTLHNTLLPGRVRLPYGENPAAYNLSVNSIDMMFATHEIRQPKASDEYRVLLIGDSSVWGVLLAPEDTLAAQINAAGHTLPDGRTVRAYNIGHPILSLTKDLLLLDEALHYQPDAVVWLTTLQSFARDRQLIAPLVQGNPAQLQPLIAQYDLTLEPPPTTADFMARTIIGQRRDLADWLRLQLYGVMWGVTGVDQGYLENYERRANDFDEDVSWLNVDTPQPLTGGELVFDVLAAGVGQAGEIPVLLVNEPVYIADGVNSDLRYNFWYPRWAYDAYREVYAQQAAANGWHYLDVWDAIAPGEFTDSPVHLTAAGTGTLAEIIGSAIIDLAETGSAGRNE